MSKNDPRRDSARTDSNSVTTPLAVAVAVLALLTSAAVVFAAWGLTTNVTLPQSLPTPVVAVLMIGIAALLAIGGVLVYLRFRSAGQNDHHSEKQAPDSGETGGRGQPQPEPRGDDSGERQPEASGQQAPEPGTDRGSRVAGATEGPDDAGTTTPGQSGRDPAPGQAGLTEGNVSQKQREEMQTRIEDDS
jgi:hypothetical protein